jgi:hypothetical protein
MLKSLTSFNEKLKENLLEIHWRQWSALGVASQIPPEQYWIIDLEALTISTLAIGLADKRLMGACVEWFIQNAEWLNTSRFKRIAGIFTRPSPHKGITVLLVRALTSLDEILKKHTHRLAIKTLRRNRTQDIAAASDYDNFFKGFTPRDIAKKLDAVQAPVLFQLLLRGYYGMDARSDLFIYLLFNKQDNSLSIARNIYYNQKNVYNILEKWSKTGLVAKTNKNYVLKKATGWRDFWNYEKKLGYLNWAKIFYLFNRILRTLSTPPWCEETYLMTSFFRDIYKDADEIGNQFNVQIPDPSGYKGALYYDVFASSMVAVLEKILKTKS